MKYVGVRGKSAKVQSKQRKLQTKSKPDSSLKSSKSEKRSRQSHSKVEHKDRLKEVRLIIIYLKVIREKFALFVSL